MKILSQIYLSIIEKSDGSFSSISFMNSCGFISKASANLKIVVNCGSFNPLSIVLKIETDISFSQDNKN